MALFDFLRKGNTGDKRDLPKVNVRGLQWELIGDSDDIVTYGYTKLIDCPEVMSCIDTIARLISSMTVYLMENGESGDTRLKNGLSRKIDIDPNSSMTRSAIMYWIVKTLLIYGNAVVFPITSSNESNGFIEELIPIAHTRVRYDKDVDSYGYHVVIDNKVYDSSDVLNFVLNPKEAKPWEGEGFKVSLKDVTFNLKQAGLTKRQFMSSKFKPSIIVRVDGMIEEFRDSELKQTIIDDYVKGAKQGEPWLIPAQQFDVKEIRPLTLNDLAINSSVEIDKRTVASIFGVPTFVLGIGTYNKDEWNNFISSRIMPIAQGIEQELTKKLLVSPNWYFKFNSRSLYAYDLKELSDIAFEGYTHGMMTGNEGRDWLGLSPKEGLDDLVILENYIPLAKVGDQEKLNGGEQ